MTRSKFKDGTIVLQVHGDSKMEIGAWDSTRWAKQYEGRTDAPKDLGGLQFGMDVDIYISGRFGEEPEATVSIGGIQPHDVETAKLRIAAYTEATEIAHEINVRMECGEAQDEAVNAVMRRYIKEGRFAR